MGPHDQASSGISSAQIAAALTSRVQQLIILPTEKCNFRCTYCYEDFAAGRMSDQVQSSLERFMDRRVPELQYFGIEWFGGEPLAARKVVLRLASYASRLCASLGIPFRGGLTTNAYVLDFALFEELLSYDQRQFQITLDGWGDGHDAVRRLAGGGGTFDRIWRNLLSTRQTDQDFSIKLRIHVRRENYESLEQLMDHIASAFGNDRRYHLDFQHLRNLGGEGGKSVERPLSIKELREIESHLRLRLSAKSRHIPAAVAQTPDLVPVEHVTAHDICYAAKPNSLLIRSDGRIGKCTVALDDDRNTIGRLQPDGSISVDNELLRLWVRGLVTRELKALECPLVGLPMRQQSLGTTAETHLS